MGICVPTSQVNSYWTQDPYWDYVELLLHGEGTNNSTTIVDSSSRARTVTASGSNVISTAQKKFGSASLKGTNGGLFTVDLNSGNSGGTMSGDFTVEWFGYNPASAVSWYATADDVENYYAYGTRFLHEHVVSSIWDYVLTCNDANNAWHHYAISRVGSNLRCFHDGALNSTNTNSDTLNFGTMRFGYYKPNNNLYNTGYWDEVRVTKGIGRYTAAFTVPFLQFPDS